MEMVQVLFKKNRWKVILSDNCVSNQIQVGYFVPHGSLAGRLLFILIVNDKKYVSESSHFVIYADRKSLLFSLKKRERCLQHRNRTLAKLTSGFMLVTT